MNFEVKNPLKNIGIHIGQISSRKELDSISDLVLFLKEKNMNIRFICDSFSPNQIEPFRVLSELHKIPITYYGGNPNSFINEISDIEVLVTTKLHSGIIAYCLGKVPVSLPAHTKSERFYRQIEMEAFCFPKYYKDLNKVKDFFEKIDSISLKETLMKKRKILQELVVEQFKIVLYERKN